ncbi:MAG: S8/S53 family peptidase [Acidobacteriota bacterium]|nr:S8/S53 family peptidase [Acidobacteriota bacterium]
MSNSESARPLAAILGAAVILAVVEAWPLSASAEQIPQNTPLFIAHAKDAGPLDPSTQITMAVWLKVRHPQSLDQLVQAQYDPSSGMYHQWISQDEFNAQFAPSPQDMETVENHLRAKGLTILAVAQNNFYVKVQGTVGQAERSFGVQIHQYQFKGEMFRSNTADPSVDPAVSPFVAAITGMDDFGYQPTAVRPREPNGELAAPLPVSISPSGLFFEGQCFRGVETETFSAGTTTAAYKGNRYGADITSERIGHLPPCGYSPEEIQTAYNMNPLYAAGYDGSGQTIVITDAFGSPTIQQDAAAFSEIYGLPPINLTVLRAPGVVHNPKGSQGGWQFETTLDVEWAHALAPGAAIVLVLGPTNHADLDEAVNYAVVHHLGNVISNSWASVEGLGNPAQLRRVNRILEQAAAEGIDVNFASGDNGDEVAATGFRTVAFPASSPFATGIGGTSLSLNPDDSIAFQTGWGNNATRIAGPLSQGNPPVIPPTNLGFIFGAGGGTSLTFAKPSFQNGLAGNMRMVPDASMLADPFTGVEIIETLNGQLSVLVIGGTSLATPAFSGIMAITTQANGGTGLGQAAQLLYSLPAGAVRDITPFSSPGDVAGLITTPGGATKLTADQLAAPLGNTKAYYSALYNSPASGAWFVVTFGTDTSLTTTVGWDDVTGVGTPNGAAFVSAITGVKIP